MAIPNEPWHMTPEGKIKAKVNARIKDLKARGAPIWKFMPVQTGYGIPALDYLLCVNGCFVAIETKKDKFAHLTPRQVLTKSDMIAAGAVVYVVFDDDTLNVAMDAITRLAMVDK